MLFFTKTLFVALLSFAACAANGWERAEPLEKGLYRSADDFRHGQLVLVANCKTGKNQLRLNEFGARPYVTAIHQGQEYKIAKVLLFGYRDCEGQEYRFASNNQHYPILNPSEELLLYRAQLPPVGRNPGYVRLFFSVTAEAPIQPLTLPNLKKAFPANHEFHDLLDAQFRPDSDLTAFDDFHGMTKINWLLQRSLALTDLH